MGARRCLPSRVRESLMRVARAGDEARAHDVQFCMACDRAKLRAWRRSENEDAMRHHVVQNVPKALYFATKKVSGQRAFASFFPSSVKGVYQPID